MPTPLDFRQVTLLPGPFAEARARNVEYLRSLDPLRLLHGFYENAGLPTRGAAYGGWEQASIAGHSLGHYLSACARLPELSDRVALILSELERCQNARTDGFIGGMPEADRIFGELKAGVVRSTGFDLNTSWVPWYNLHKLFAGLLDSPPRRAGDGGLALRLAVRLADWAWETTANLTDDLWQQMLGCEFGGMSEVLAALYARTGEPRHLALAEKFYHKAVLDPLAEGIDCLPGLHGNTQVPKILGCARLYELTGNEKYRRIVENFWRFVTEHHTYVIGGHGSGEYFGPEGALSERLGNTTCETCNTYNMLRLSRYLFAWEPKASYADFQERALYNHILASQHRETGMLCYFMPLQSSRFKSYSTPEDSFWCCVGTGMENHARYEEYVAVADGETLYVNQYVDAEIQYRGVTVRMGASLPFGAHSVAITVQGEGPLTLKLRRPWWLVGEGPFCPLDAAGYGTLEYTGGAPASLLLNLPMELHAEALPDAPNRQALLYGPLVLAAELGAAPAPHGDDGGEAHDARILLAPVVVGATALEEAVHAFTLASLPVPVALRPLARLHNQRYAVYFDTFTPEQWALEEENYRAAERQEHEKWTQVVDEFWPNQMQPERDHHYQGENTLGAEKSAWKYRQAGEDGWFSFTLRTLPHRPMALFCKWGPPEQGEVAFTVDVEGEVIAIPTFAPERHRHLDRVYAIPEPLTQGKERVTVRVSGPSVPLFLARMQKLLPGDL